MCFPTQHGFDYPTLIAGSYFDITMPRMASCPTFVQWQTAYHQPFLMYLYYMLVQGSTGAYLTSPLSISQRKELVDKINQGGTTKPIKNILIGEAPPASGAYWYDPFKWPANYSHWIGAPYKAIYGSIPNMKKPKSDYLVEMAKQGFLLLDLFPFAIKITSKERENPAYASAAIDAFGGCPNPYPFNILSCLDELKGCIAPSFSIAFGQKKFGDAILESSCSVNALTKWTLANTFSLHPTGSIDNIRKPPHPIANSVFCRVISSTSGNPNADLLILAGFH